MTAREITDALYPLPRSVVGAPILPPRGVGSAADRQPQPSGVSASPTPKCGLADTTAGRTPPKPTGRSICTAILSGTRHERDRQGSASHHQRHRTRPVPNRPFPPTGTTDGAGPTATATAPDRAHPAARLGHCLLVSYFASFLGSISQSLQILSRLFLTVAQFLLLRFHLIRAD